MSTVAKSTPSSAASVHLDLDGARHIFRLHGWPYDRVDDPLFETGLQHALDCFSALAVTATLFVIAEDLEDPSKRPLLEEAARRGHEIASHSLTHARLAGLAHDIKRREIFESRARLEQALCVPVQGFRAPDFSLDHSALELIAAAGYSYDSSMTAARRFPADGEARVPTSPHRPIAGATLLELPLPAQGSLPFPFHPSYSLVLGSAYFRLGAMRALHSSAPFVLLFHLTDFADPVPGVGSWLRHLYTLSHRSGEVKRAQCRRMIEYVRGARTIVSTSQIINTVHATSID